MYLRKYFRELRDLVFLGSNIFFIFWPMQLEQKDGTGEIGTSIVCPMVMRSTWREYDGLVEHTAYMGISHKSGERFLQFESRGLYVAKKRSDKIAVFEKANLADIFTKLRG